MDLFPVDIGMVTDVPAVTRPEHKVAYGTEDMMKGPAMTREQAAQAVLNGIRIVRELAEKEYDILATGEMGIGNTTTSSAVVSVLLEKDVEAVTGRGAGLSAEGLRRKVQVIREAIRLNEPDRKDALDVLAKVGGFDIAGLAGVFLGGALCHIPGHDRRVHLIGCGTVCGENGAGVQGLYAGISQVRGDGRRDGAGRAGAV